MGTFCRTLCNDRSYQAVIEGRVAFDNIRKVTFFLLTSGVGVLIAIFITELSLGVSLTHARTVALTTIVFAQFFHVFNSRSERISVFRQDPTNNRFLFFSVVAAAVAHLALLYVPIMRTVFRTTALNLRDLLIVIAAASTVLIASELDKWRIRSSLR